MEIVKKDEEKKVKPSKKNAEKLKTLLLKKAIMERQIKQSEHAANLSCAYASQMELRAEALLGSTILGKKLEFYKLKYELLEVKRVASGHISDFKEFKQKYERGLVGEIKAVVDKEGFDKIEFDKIEDDAKELLQHELYGKVVVEAENIEHPNVISNLVEYIDILDNLILEIKKELDNNKSLSPLEQARLRKELFDYSIHRQTINKRLNKRKEYYSEQFLPMFEKDMKECDENLEDYLKTANKIIESGIDPVLKIMVPELIKNKGDREQLWQHFTALRSRLKAIALVIGRNQKKNPELVDSLKKFTN